MTVICRPTPDELDVCLTHPAKIIPGVGPGETILRSEEPFVQDAAPELAAPLIWSASAVDRPAGRLRPEGAKTRPVGHNLRCEFQERA